MAVYTWKTGVGGDWNTLANWTPAAVPNDPLAAVGIDAAPSPAPYSVAIAAGETQTVYGLSLNPTTNAAGTNVAPYNAATLQINGELVFSPGSPGLLAGPLQNLVLMNNGTIVNPGTVNAFIQGEGNVLFTGTNGFYVTNWLQSLSGNVTVDTASIAELTGNTLFDGIFEASGVGGLINLGGPLQHLVVNIGTIEGPPTNPTGWTEIYLDGPTDYVREWNGSTYVNLETTLTDIAARGTVDVLGGRVYTSVNPIGVNGGLLNLQNATFNAAALNVNTGVVQGSGTIGSVVINNSSVAAVGGDLNILGPITGTGTLGFDFDHKAGTVTTGSILEVRAVAPGETVVMNGGDILKLDAPPAFAGAVSAQVGDQILLGGITANSAALNNGTLSLSFNGQVVDAIRLAGTYTGDTFTATPVVGGTTLTVAGAAAPFTVADGTTATQITAPGSAYAGGTTGPQHAFTDLSPTNLYITAGTPGSFITTGAGNDTINVSKANGNNVLDGGTGSNTLIGGTGVDTFQINDAAPAASIADVVNNFHSGDYATIFGVSQAGFTVGAQTVTGPGNVSELQYTFASANQPTATLTLVGHSFADISSGRITATYGTTTGTATGEPLLSIHAT